MNGAAPGRRLAVIIGSGMGGVADRFALSEVIPFVGIDGLGEPGVPGHRGEVHVCRSHARDLFLVLGRRHLYEGGRDRTARLVDFLAARGATHVVSVSAAGALRSTLVPGEFVVASAVMNMQNPAPAGVNTRAGIDPALARDVEEAGRRAGVALRRGVMVCCAGPVYETRAEVQFLQQTGADVATMSGAGEVEACVRRHIPVAALALVTNPATGIASAVPRHPEVVEVARAAVDRLGRLIAQLAEI